MQHFPLLVCYHQDDEMTTLRDSDSLKHWLAQSKLFITDEDRFIDSQGYEWALTSHGEFKATGTLWTLTDLTLRVQQHFAAQANCCVAKITAPDLKQLIQMVIDSATD